jgi:acetyl esterase/lipase
VERKRSCSCTAARGGGRAGREQAFPAEAVIAAGAAYVALNFEKLPAVTLPRWRRKCSAGIEWVYQNLSKDVVLCAHSSGAHLSACALVKLSVVRSALLISGVYDLLRCG